MARMMRGNAAGVYGAAAGASVECDEFAAPGLALDKGKPRLTTFMPVSTCFLCENRRRRARFRLARIE
jgi:hypothetical protein